MKWTEVCDDPLLKDMPYKIQTDKWDNIVMTPASNEHGIYQAQIIVSLYKLIDSGTIISECSVQTSEGVKVADVAWASDEFMQRQKGKNPFYEAPEVCVEILSPFNTLAEMNEKKELYFARGADEFWVCDASGNIIFYVNTGTIESSKIIKNFSGVL